MSLRDRVPWLLIAAVIGFALLWSMRDSELTHGGWIHRCQIAGR